MSSQFYSEWRAILPPFRINCEPCADVVRGLARRGEAAALKAFAAEAHLAV
jgi:hypothetical protein